MSITASGYQNRLQLKDLNSDTREKMRILPQQPSYNPSSRLQGIL
jgi:hypothetical protein